MMMIDEAIKHQRCMAEKYKYKLVLNETGNPMFSLGNREIPRIEKYVEEYEQVASWLEELKLYKNLDLEIPQHFTKEQNMWIKKYCIEKNKEFYKQGVDDLKNELLEICAGYNSTYDSQIIYIAEQLKGGVVNGTME